MPRRLLVGATWMLAVAALAAAIGMRVRSHRLADPVQTLRAYLPWVPDDLGGLSAVVGRSERTGELGLQIEIRGRAADVARFAARNGMSRVDTPLYGAAPIARWMLIRDQRPDTVVHLSLPSDGGPALISIVDGSRR